MLLPPLGARAAALRSPAFGQVLRAIARDRPFLTFTVLLTGYWFLHNQIYISVPLRAAQAGGSVAIVGVLYAINAVAGLALQYPLVRLASARLTPLALVAAGIALMGLGLGLMALPAGPAVAWPMAAAVIVFAAGRALVEPAKDTVTAAMAPPGALAANFSVAFLALAVGGSAGNYAGGWLFDLASASGAHALPWLVFAGAGLGIAAGLLAFARRVEAAPAG
jgi:DHA1 family multidrug resistance protein-like MFS transporter